MSYLTLYQENRYTECEALCREILKSEKQNLEARKYLIKSIEGMGDLEAAISECDSSLKFCKNKDDQAEFLHLKAVALVKAGNLQQAALSYSASLAKNPGRTSTWFLLASCQFELNQFNECEKSTVQVLKRANEVTTDTIGHTIYLLAQSRRSLTATMLFKRFPSAKNAIPVPYYHFALAELYEREKNFTQALQHLDEGNRLVRQLTGYTIERDLDTIQFYSSLSSELVEPDFDDSTPTPIFILGMPRTGSSLLEQMLGNHSSIQPMGELTWLPRAFESAMQRIPEPRTRNQLRSACNDEDFISSVRRNYFEQMTGVDKPFLIDKLPGNFLYLGLFGAIFPGAMVLHTQREKFATVWSCYRTPFVDGQGFSHDLSDVSAYYDAVEKSIGSAARNLGTRYNPVSYETLVNDPGEVLTGLLSKLELPFEDACLEHTNSKRLVSTASRFQVTQPIYKDANSAWKPYESMISDRIKH